MSKIRDFSFVNNARHIEWQLAKRKTTTEKKKRLLAVRLCSQLQSEDHVFPNACIRTLCTKEGEGREIGFYFRTFFFFDSFGKMLFEHELRNAFYLFLPPPFHPQPRACGVSVCVCEYFCLFVCFCLLFICWRFLKSNALCI